MTPSDLRQIQGGASRFVPGTAPVSMTCTQFFTNQFAQSASVFARLVRIASLLDPATGRYIEPAAASLFGEHSVDQELRALHLKIFRDWLSNSLEDQQREVETCGAPPRMEARTTMLKWLANGTERLIPPGALEHERMLFQADLSIVQHLLRQ